MPFLHIFAIGAGNFYTVHRCTILYVMTIIYYVDVHSTACHNNVLFKTYGIRHNADNILYDILRKLTIRNAKDLLLLENLILCYSF